MFESTLNFDYIDTTVTLKTEIMQHNFRVYYLNNGADWLPVFHGNVPR